MSRPCSRDTRASKGDRFLSFQSRSGQVPFSPDIHQSFSVLETNSALSAEIQSDKLRITQTAHLENHLINNTLRNLSVLESYWLFSLETPDSVVGAGRSTWQMDFGFP